MRPLRVYLDTSVIGGAFDEEFAQDTQTFMEGISTGQVIPVISDVVQTEVARAPQKIQELLAEIQEFGAEIVALDKEADQLATAYLEAGVIPATFRDDAAHIAIATLARVDVLVSWNFKHIVKLQRIRGFNGVNLMKGYPSLEIRSPKEVVTDGNH